MERSLATGGLEVRARIAAGYLGAHGTEPVLGDIVLRPHQQAAVGRLHAALEHFGGALLADDVGLGKTYVAAAIARNAARPLIIAPAALREMWETALRRTGVPAAFISYETLSRGRSPASPPDLLVLDEAHHARNPRTARHRRLAALAADAPVLLLSATPVHNSRADLRALLGLFLGSRAAALTDRELADCVIRRERHDLDPSEPMPELLEARWVSIGGDDDVLREILALPPPVPTRDGGHAAALVIFSLVRQWASSHAALLGALRRRRAVASALMASLECGRHPSRAELAAWSFAEGALQLAFPELVVAHDGAPTHLLRAVRRHDHALSALVARLAGPSTYDAERARRLLDVRAAHRGEKIIAFSQFADTVAEYYRRLRGEPGVAALSARGAVVAGGALSRREALRRFAPLGTGACPPPVAERIDLLLTTDLLSEGVDLRDASVVVHLDLPWTPARLEQRVGRARRLGATHPRVAVYAMRPPAAAEELLQVEPRLRAKLREAACSVGARASILPSAVPVALGLVSAVMNTAAPSGAGDADAPPPSPARRETELRRMLEGWCTPTQASAAGNARVQDGIALTAGTLRVGRRGVLALLRQHGQPMLIGSLDGGDLTDDAAVLAEVARLAGSPGAVDRLLDSRDLARALDAVALWSARRQAAEAIGDAPAMAGAARRRVLRRIAAITARAPVHRRPALAPVAARAMVVATGRLGAYDEDRLAELASRSMADDAWLAAIAAMRERRSVHARLEPDGPHLTNLAVLLLVP